MRNQQQTKFTKGRLWAPFLLSLLYGRVVEENGHEFELGAVEESEVAEFEGGDDEQG